MGGRDNKAAIIDISGATPVVTSAGTLSQVRSWSNATVLADGKVAVTGGSAVANTTTQVAYQMELFDPITKAWTVGPSAPRMRLYHSTSVLLPDATLFTGGGGAPGPQTNLNAEIYYPPYLFKQDGTLATATDDRSGAEQRVEPSVGLHAASRRTRRRSRASRWSPPDRPPTRST